jgi:hypothetical protein
MLAVSGIEKADWQFTPMPLIDAASGLSLDCYSEHFINGVCLSSLADDEQILRSDVAKTLPRAESATSGAKRK